MSDGGLNLNTKHGGNMNTVTPIGFFPASTPMVGMVTEPQLAQQQQVPFTMSTAAAAAAVGPWNNNNINNAVCYQYYDPSTGNTVQCYQQHPTFSTTHLPVQVPVSTQLNVTNPGRGYNVSNTPSNIVDVSGNSMMMTPFGMAQPAQSLQMQQLQQQHQQYHTQQYQHPGLQHQSSNYNTRNDHNTMNNNGYRHPPAMLNRNDNRGNNGRNFNGINNRNDSNNRGGRSYNNNYNNQTMNPRNNRNNNHHDIQQHQTYKRARDRNFDNKSNNNVYNNPVAVQQAQQQQYTCEPCTMSFDTKIALENHVKSHVKCSQCDFYAVPKVINGHFAKMHGKFSANGFKTITVAVPGCKVQKFRICVGNHPDDVASWIADRKKRFPRQTNSNNNNNNNNNNTNNNNSITKSSPTATSIATQNKQQKQQQSNLHDGTIASLASIQSTPTTTIDPKSETLPSVSTSNATTTIGISSLLAGYGSDSSATEEGEEQEEGENDTKEEGEEEEEEDVDDEGGNICITFSTDTADVQNLDHSTKQHTNEIVKDPTTSEAAVTEQTSSLPSNHRTRTCRFFARTGTCRNGTNCNFRHDTVSSSNDVMTKNNTLVGIGTNGKRQMGISDNNDITFNKKVRVTNSIPSSSMEPSLLRKLLNEDIRREKVLSIKLLKYIVQMNFFKPSTNPVGLNNNDHASLPISCEEAIDKIEAEQILGAGKEQQQNT